MKATDAKPFLARLCRGSHQFSAPVRRAASTWKSYPFGWSGCRTSAKRMRRRKALKNLRSTIKSKKFFHTRLHTTICGTPSTVLTRGIKILGCGFTPSKNYETKPVDPPPNLQIPRGSYFPPALPRPWLGWSADDLPPGAHSEPHEAVVGSQESVRGAARKQVGPDQGEHVEEIVLQTLFMNSERVKNDFYETPPWQSSALRKRVQISGSVLECCVGDGSLSKMFPDCSVSTNDIDPDRIADFHLDAAAVDSWQQFPKVDWVVTNPPFNAAMPILRMAHAHARFGVVMLLRLSFMEPTKEREGFLSTAPPQRQIILPRWSYKQNGSTDSVTTAWFVWQKSQLPIEIVPTSEKTP